MNLGYFIIFIAVGLVIGASVFIAQQVNLTGYVISTGTSESPTNETIQESKIECPESCSDNNPCSIDWCNETSNYICSQVPINGTSNECWGNSTLCSVNTCISGECTEILLTNCCGNNVCESSESCNSCANDCGECPISIPIAGSSQTTQSNTTENQTDTGGSITNQTSNETIVTLDHIIINEILTKAPMCGDKEGFEFIELYNPTSSPVSIGDWWIVYYTSTKTDWNDYVWRKQMPSGIQLAPNSYYLIAVSIYWSDCTEKPNWTVQEDFNMGYTAKDGKLTPSKSTIALHSSFGSVVDAMGWGETALYEGAPAIIEIGKSLERKSLTTDTDNNSNDFILATPSPRNSANQ